ncbi:unnamed protein product, partial [Polarella glacialis]
MLRHEPPEIEGSLRKLPSEACSPDMVMQSHEHVGRKIADYERPALLFDAELPGAPIVGASRGFEQLTGRSRESVIGSYWRIVQEDVHEQLVSRSASQDIDSFLRMARMWNVNSMADATHVMASRRVDGSSFSCRNLFRSVKAEEWSSPGRKSERHMLVLAVQAEVEQAEKVQLQQSKADFDLDCFDLDKLTEMIGADPTKELWSDMSAFYPAPLSSKCILLNQWSSCMRREPHQ